MAKLPELPSGLPSKGGGSIGNGSGGNGNSGTIIKLVGAGLISAVLVVKECKCFHRAENLASKEESKKEEPNGFVEEGLKELIKEGYDKLTQPNDTNNQINSPTNTFPKPTYPPVIMDPSKANTLNSNKEACNLLEGSWVAILKYGDGDPIVERWNFRCYGDDKIEVGFDGGIFCGNSCFIKGNIYITDIYFNYNDFRGYDYSIKLKLDDEKLYGKGSRKWKSDNKTYEYVIELRRNSNRN